MITGIHLPCYDLREMISEKLRALSGQRKYAISRDLFDVHQLLKREELILVDVLPILVRKFEVKNIPISNLNPDYVKIRKDEFELDWGRNLVHLIPLGEETTFDQGWATCLEAFDYLHSIL